MSLFTNENGIFQKTFGFIGKLIAINFLWMLCSLPIITMGASTTALYFTMIKLHKYGDCSIRDYMQSFRQNFVQATKVWFFLIGFAGMLMWVKGAAGGMSGIVQLLCSYGTAACGIPLFLTILFVFPTIAAFENRTKVLVANAFFFSVKNLFFTICIAAITIFPMFFTMVDGKLFPIYVFVWLLCGFALTAYANSWFFYKIFKSYLGDEGEEDLAINEQQYVA